MNVISGTAFTASTATFRILSGSDDVRVGVFLGIGTSAVLQAQCAIFTAGIGQHSIPLTVVGAGTLNVSANTNYVIGFTVDGLSARVAGYTCVVDSSISGINTTDLVIAPGFSTNPQALTSSGSFPCVRIH